MRGSFGTVLGCLRACFFEANDALLRKQEPLTPALSRREREKSRLANVAEARHHGGMTRRLLVLAALSVAVPARAEPLCALPEVLRALDTELQRHGIYGTLDDRSVGELTGPEGGTTSCAIRVVVRGYDTNTYGDRPIDRIEVRTYIVSHLRNGLMVRLDR